MFLGNSSRSCSTRCSFLLTLDQEFSFFVRDFLVQLGYFLNHFGGIEFTSYNDGGVSTSIILALD